MLLKIIFQVIFVIMTLFISPNFTSHTYAQESAPASTVTREEYNQLLQEFREVRSENYQNIVDKADNTIARAELFVNIFAGFATIASLVFAVSGAIYVFLQRRDLGEAKNVVEYLNKQANFVRENSKIIAKAKEEVTKDLKLYKKQKNDLDEFFSEIENKAELNIKEKAKNFENKLKETYDELNNTANRINNLGTVSNYVSNATPYVPISSVGNSLLDDYGIKQNDDRSKIPIISERDYGKEWQDFLDSLNERPENEKGNK